MVNEVKVEVVFIYFEFIDVKNIEKELKGLDGIFVVFGFGECGIEGKIEVVCYV